MGQHTVNVVDALTPDGGIRLCKPVPAGTMLTKMDSTPASLAQSGPDSIRKAAIRGGWQHSLAEQLDVERDAQRELGRSADYAEGVAAFGEKRAPRFTGR